MCGGRRGGDEVSLVHLWISMRIGIYAGWRRETKEIGLEGRDETGPPAYLYQGWVISTVLGRSLVELSSTLKVRLKKNRRLLFTVKTGL